MKYDEWRAKSDLSYWFPKLLASGVPVPRTQIIRVEEEPLEWMAFEDRNVGRHPKLTKLEADLDLTIASEFEYPCFLRTGQTSGKHDFERNCLVQGPGVLGERIRNLIYYSEMIDLLGLSCKTWAVRELLPVDPVCVLPEYGNMPLVPEQRCFLAGGRLVCRHPYWPKDSLVQGFAAPEADCKQILEFFDKADSFPPAIEFDFYKTVTTVADAFDGDGNWSLDMLLTRNGWVAIDMAVAELSYHWPDCKKMENVR